MLSVWLDPIVSKCVFLACFTKHLRHMKGRTERSGGCVTRTADRRGKQVVCHQSAAIKDLPVSRKCLLPQEAVVVSSREVWHGHDVWRAASAEHDAKNWEVHWYLQTSAKTKSLTRMPTAEKAVKERGCTQMPVAKKERTGHKCLGQRKKDQTTNDSGKRKMAALIRQANKKRLP